MKTIKFRLIKKNKNWYAQVKNIFQWKTIGEWHGSDAGSVFIETSFKNKKLAIKGVKNSIEFKNDRVVFVQYPTIKYH